MNDEMTHCIGYCLLQPKRYVAGSQQDQTGSSNLAIGIGAGVLGSLILLAGVVGGKGGVVTSESHQRSQLHV